MCAIQQSSQTGRAKVRTKRTLDQGHYVFLRLCSLCELCDRCRVVSSQAAKSVKRSDASALRRGSESEPGLEVGQSSHILRRR